MLVDVDRDTKLPKLPKDPKAVDETALQKIVGEGKFDAEVAIVHRSGSDGGSDYVYYDTDGRLRQGADAQACRLKDAKLETDAAIVPGKMLRHKTVFKDKALGPKWKAIALQLFRSGSIEE